MLIEAEVERYLFEGKNPVGAIFWLKNHAGYSDKTETAHTGADGKPLAVGNTVLVIDSREKNAL